MPGFIGALTFIYGGLHTYAVATGGALWMLLGAALILYEFGAAPGKNTRGGGDR